MTDKYGATPLSAAYHNNNENILRLLIENLADINKLDSETKKGILKILFKNINPKIEAIINIQNALSAQNPAWIESSLSKYYNHCTNNAIKDISKLHEMERFILSKSKEFNNTKKSKEILYIIDSFRKNIPTISLNR